MPGRFIKKGKVVKMEVNVIPSYLSLQGTIVELKDDYIILETDINYAQKGAQKVKCTITDDDKTMVCLFETTIKQGENKELILIRPDGKRIQITQRRKYVRVPINKETSCYLIGIKGRQVESDRPFASIIKDISGGGVLLNSKMSLPINTVLFFELQLIRDSFLLTVEVLREMENNKDGTNDFGCQFIGISDTDRQKIVDYCNKKHMSMGRRL